jgi:hypothetical protein
LVRDAGDETAVFDPSTGVLAQLNATAFAIWRACDGETTPEEIATALADLTGLSSQQILGEVEATIGTLLDQGLLERD